MPTSAMQFNSGRFPDIRDSLKHSVNNPVLLPNTSKRIIVDGKFISEEPMFLAKERKSLLMSDLYSYNINTQNQFSPEFISEKLFGSPDYWYIIMLVNGFTYPTEIKPPSILVPTKSSLIKFLNIIEKNKNKYEDSRISPTNIEKRLVTALGV